MGEPNTEGWSIESATLIINGLIQDKKITRKCGKDLIAWAEDLVATINKGRKQ